MTRPPADPGVAAAYRDKGYWHGRTIADSLRDAARRVPAKVAVIDNRHGQITYAELHDAAGRVAAQLAACGVGRGDIVPVMLPNWQHITAYLAALRSLGAVPALVPTNWRERELMEMLTLTEARAIIVADRFRDRRLASMALELRERSGSLETIIAIDGPLSDPPAIHGGKASARPVDAKASAPPLEALLFTSGSSGEAKGVMHSTDSLGAMNATVAPQLGLTEADTIFMGAPVGYSAGLVHGVRLAAFMGATLVLQEYWEPNEALALMAEHRATFTLTTPTLLHDLVECDDLAALRDRLVLRLTMCGGGFASEDLMRAAHEAFPRTFTTRLWGMTEGIGTACRPDTPLEKVLTTDGQPFLGTELRILRDGESDAEPGEAGELLLRGPQLFQGYFKRPAYTEEAFLSDGWFRTGDLASRDEDGFLRLVGRRKELIIRGGANIAPSDIEPHLLADERIAQCAVVGVPDERLGERVCACVVQRADATLTLADAVEIARAAGLSRQKWPEELVVLPALPMTAGGKVQRETLKGIARDHVRARRPMEKE